MKTANEWLADWIADGDHPWMVSVLRAAQLDACESMRDAAVAECNKLITPDEGKRVVSAVRLLGDRIANISIDDLMTQEKTR